MSYRFTFEKKELVMLAGLGSTMSLLLLAGGFAIGQITAIRSALALAKSSPTALAQQALTTQLAAQKKASAQPKAGAGTAADAAPVDGDGTPTATSSDGGGVAVVIPDADAPATEAAKEAPSLHGLYTLQFGAFHDPANAKALAAELKDEEIKATVSELSDDLGTTYTVVRFGSYATVASAMQAASEQGKKSKHSPVIRPADRL